MVKTRSTTASENGSERSGPTHAASEEQPSSASHVDERTAQATVVIDEGAAGHTEDDVTIDEHAGMDYGEPDSEHDKAYNGPRNSSHRIRQQRNMVEQAQAGTSRDVPDMEEGANGESEGEEVGDHLYPTTEPNDYLDEQDADEQVERLDQLIAETLRAKEKILQSQKRKLKTSEGNNKKQKKSKNSKTDKNDDVTKDSRASWDHTTFEAQGEERHAVPGPAPEVQGQERHRAPGPTLEGQREIRRELQKEKAKDVQGHPQAKNSMYKRNKARNDAYPKDTQNQAKRIKKSTILRDIENALRQKGYKTRREDTSDSSDSDNQNQAKRIKKSTMMQDIENALKSQGYIKPQREDSSNSSDSDDEIPEHVFGNKINRKQKNQNEFERLHLETRWTIFSCSPMK